MAEHGGGKDPISSIGFAVFGGLLSVFGVFLALGIFMGMVTGNAPIRAEWANVFAWGQLIGAWFNVGGNTGIQTFAPEDYFKNSRKVGSDTKPDQRLIQAPKSNTILPTATSNNTQTLDFSTTSTQFVAPYQDLNGDGVISPEEIEAQNKARKQ